jgi:hypothetical protein
MTDRIVTRRTEIPDAPYYVIAHDTFMSGWGRAEGKENWVILPAETELVAQDIAENARNRTEMKSVRITAEKPTPWADRGFRVWSLLTRETAARWYQQGAFTK